MKLRRRKNRDEWETLIKEWEISNETQKAFCDRKGVNYTTFLKWRQQLNTSDAPSESDADVFLPLRVRKSADKIGCTNYPFSLILNHAYRLEIPQRVPKAELRKLFIVLGVLV